ncbi:hypothetical protein M011DRAFT_401869 [Sporormia fimetaria CBS 119925]|uniref:Uncharacterized protein n=1 Tax=Sporormia fimetaria CBS 119925 TaxID=1340428 RepID=A0A6A6VC19_9PLEO|nr:hypothetical protein M011DRAFT_401869 [Sporormia fimetaria CBS 119925]
MAIINHLKDKLWSYVSPRKTPSQRRDKEFQMRAPPLPQLKPIKAHRRSTMTEARSPAEESTPDNALRRMESLTLKDDQMAEMGDQDPAELPPSPPSSLESSALERAYTDVEGELIIDDIANALNPDSEGEWDANEDTVVLDEADYLEAQRQAAAKRELQRQRQDIQGRELRAAGWTEDAVFLFQKLGMRGFEPLLPAAWYSDFSFLPVDLFTHNLDKAFVKPVNPDQFSRGSKALYRLFEVGGRVRDAVANKPPIRTPEWQIRYHIQQYNKWAQIDANTYHNTLRTISLFDIIAVRKHVPAAAAEARMLKKLTKRAAQWRAAFEVRRTQDAAAATRGSKGKAPVVSSSADPGPDLPTLYGVVACHTVMAFVSYDVHAKTPMLRTVAMFDLGQDGYDVWNSLAIAIFVCHCRNRLLELREFLPRAEVLESSDDDV